ncbi:MAG: hypothetical protein JNL09_04285 [Anaerolineales bacterium]|nr:hypothetical protein [Anaerolineales bacterium]
MNTRTLSTLLALAMFSAACQPASVPPTQTPAPEPTLAPSQMATATTEPTHPPTATATLEPTPTPCAAWPTPNLSFEPSTETSPNGQWTLTIATSDPVATACSPTSEAQYVKVVVANGAVEWKLIEQWENYGLGVGRYMPLRWSEDGERLYFTYAAMPDGCQGLSSNIGLWRADLHTGETKQILTSTGFLLGLTPDETQALYRPFGAGGLVLFNFTSQTETPISLPPALTAQTEYSLGPALWAPDGSGMLLNIWLNFCSPPFAPENTLLITGLLSTGETEIILESPTQGFMAQAWPELDKVQVHDKTGAEWWLNPQTGAVTQP